MLMLYLYTVLALHISLIMINFLSFDIWHTTAIKYSVYNELLCFIYSFSKNPYTDLLPEKIKRPSFHMQDKKLFSASSLPFQKNHKH